MTLRHRLGTAILLALLAACGGNETSAGAGGSGGWSSSGGSSSSGEDVRRYAIESAIVEYELSGTPSGTETQVFDDYGAREASVRNHVVEIAGFRQETSTVSITEGPWITTLDDAERRATRIQNPLYEDLMRSVEDGDVEELGERMMRQMGGEKVGTEEVAGRTCDVWEVPVGNSRTWIWKGIPLKTEVTMGPMSSSMVATSVTVDPDMPASRFEVPDGYEVVEQDLSGILGR